MAQISEAAKERERQEKKFLAPIPETVSTFDYETNDSRSDRNYNPHQSTSLSINKSIGHSRRTSSQVEEQKLTGTGAYDLDAYQSKYGSAFAQNSS